MTAIGALIFSEFELLDLFGPLEMFGVLPNNTIHLIGETLTPIASTQGPRSIPDRSFEDDASYDILLIPGGLGARMEVNNPRLLRWVRCASSRAKITASVCTGAALLAAAGILDTRSATTNKLAWQWATGFGINVDWRRSARWVEDGEIFTSSGVSAGIDMSLALIAKLCGIGAAEQIAHSTEYLWHRDASHDPFAVTEVE